MKNHNTAPIKSARLVLGEGEVVPARALWKGKTRSRGWNPNPVIPEMVLRSGGFAASGFPRMFGSEMLPIAAWIFREGLVRWGCIW